RRAARAGARGRARARARRGDAAALAPRVPGLTRDGRSAAAERPPDLLEAAAQRPPRHHGLEVPELLLEAPVLPLQAEEALLPRPHLGRVPPRVAREDREHVEDGLRRAGRRGAAVLGGGECAPVAGDEALR